MILFTIALPQELKIIKEEIKKIEIKGIKIDFLLTGVGVLNTIYSIKDYISKNNKPDFIINLGVCGKTNNDFNDFFQVYRITSLSNNKEAICPIYVKNSELKSIACSEKIITNKNELLEKEFVDMESFGIDFICSKEKIPYIIIKKPFDIVGEKSKKVSLTKLEDDLKGFNYNELINKITNFLGKNKNDFENKIILLKEKYRLTFSETELLKKFINKNIAFGNTNIEFKDKNDLLIKIKS